MKRCPECGPEYDNTMMLYPDDGAELLYGPASTDEPATAILHETADQKDASTRAQIFATDQTAVFPRGCFVSAHGHEKGTVHFVVPFRRRGRRIERQRSGVRIAGQAFEEHSDSSAGLKYFPLMRNLDSDSRFRAIIRRAGLPE